MDNENQTGQYDHGQQIVHPLGEQPAPQQTAKTGKMKKPMLVGLIVAAAVAVLGAGTALAYSLWYQNPDKVLADSMVNLVSHESMSGESVLTASTEESTLVANVVNRMADGRVAIEADVDFDPAEGSKMSIAGNVVLDRDDTMYIQVNNAEELLDTLISSQIGDMDDEFTEAEVEMANAMVRGMLEPIVEEIDGQWIKITPNDSDDDEQSVQTECVADAVRLVTEDASAQRELAQTYRDNVFMVMTEKLGYKDGNIGFMYKLDEAKAEEFGEALKETKVGKKAAECSEANEGAEELEEESVDGSLDEVSEVTLELWTDRWTHEVANVTITTTSEDDETTSLKYTPNYDAEVKIDIPTDAITFDELTERLGGASLPL